MEYLLLLHVIITQLRGMLRDLVLLSRGWRVSTLGINTTVTVSGLLLEDLLLLLLSGAYGDRRIAVLLWIGGNARIV